MALPTLTVALKDGFGEAVVACDMPEPCKFPCLDSCQKRFLWTHTGIDLAPHPVVGLVLQVEDAEKFPQALGFKVLDPGSFCPKKTRSPNDTIASNSSLSTGSPVTPRRNR